MSRVPFEFRASDRASSGDLRVILFDIDGTLIRASRRGEYRRLAREMLEDIFGTSGRISEVDFAGKTDLAIYSEALECAGISLASIRERLSLLEAAKVDLIARMARDGEVFHLCSGVRELLNAISQESRLIPSLLTGNLEGLARAKLQLVGLWHYFPVRGAFGSDHEERDHLPAIAAQRISEHFGRQLSPEQFVIVGDTPRDISCARHFGARVIAVASGQHSTEQLAQFSPDGLLEDLAETEEVLALLASI